MKRGFSLPLILILILSCQDSADKIISVVSLDTVRPTKKIEVQKDTAQLEEYFADSTNIGRRSLNKIELSKYRAADSNYIVIHFFSQKNGRWNLRNEFQFAKDGVVVCDTKLSDFNNDGLNDMTYVSNIAARGANEIRRLFVYNKNKDELIYVKNSENYPNMLYNKELNCIDAWLFYGGCSTVFLKIEGDSLEEFASVELMDGLTVRTFDKSGKETVIRRDTTSEAGHIRYKNFRPLKEYGD
jgi:hypothetical protein